MGNLTYWQMVRIQKLEDEYVRLYKEGIARKQQSLTK